MNFTEIVKGKSEGSRIPENVLRVRKYTAVLAPNISERMQATREPTDGGGERVRLGIALDRDNHAIKLVPNSLNAYAWFTPRSGRTLSLRITPYIRRHGLEAGDYLLAGNSENLEFVRQ